MRLLLAITSEEKNQLGHRARHEFDHSGGTIGRNASCSWVLPDPTNVLSARHASISYNGRGFQITDTSTNGVYVNTVSASIGRGNAAFLSHGDTLYLGGFELSVAIIEDSAEERRRLGVGQMALTMRTDQTGAGSAPQFASAAEAIRPRRPDPPPPEPFAAPSSVLSSALPLPSNEPRIRLERTPIDAGSGRAAPTAPAPPVRAATDAAPILPGAATRSLPAATPTPPRQVIPHDIFADLLGVPDRKTGSASPRPSGAFLSTPNLPGAGASPSGSGLFGGPSAPAQPSASSGKAPIIPDTIDFGDLLAAPLSNGQRIPNDLGANPQAASMQASPRIADDSRSLTPSFPTASVAPDFSQPPIGEAVTSTVSSAPLSPASSIPTPQQSEPAIEAPAAPQGERTSRAASLSAALQADMVALRPLGAGEDAAGQRALDPVAVLRQRAASQGMPLPKPEDQSGAFANLSPNTTQFRSPPRLRQAAEPTTPLIPEAPRTPSTARLEPASQDHLADAFWSGLGLDPASVPPQLQADLLAECGRALREAVAGLVPVLTARRSLKDELRMDQTRLKPKENNPLKFLPSGEAVLQALIDRKLTGFLPLSQAIREGFGDIKAHEVAALVALDAVIKNLLARFDPASMEVPGASSKLFGRGPDKTKLWDNFVRVHTTLSGNLEETTRKLVGEEFARAYAQQVDAARRGGE